MKKLIELRIAAETDRLLVANVLIKNGYACSQVKSKDEGAKTATYKLHVYSQEAGREAGKQA